MGTLYHGSQCGSIKMLEPRISLGFEKLVYATNDVYYALVRAGRQVDKIREEYYGIDKPFELAECYPGAFIDTFSCPGYIYLVDEDKFVDMEFEFTSMNPVKPTGMIKIDNVWDTMQQCGDHYAFHFYGADDYWSHVRGGREGYLERKMANKRKMWQMIEMDKKGF